MNPVVAVGWSPAYWPVPAPTTDGSCSLPVRRQIRLGVEVALVVGTVGDGAHVGVEVRLADAGAVDGRRVDGTENAAQARPPARTMRRTMSRFTRRAPYKVSSPELTSASGSNSSSRLRTASGAESPLRWEPAAGPGPPGTSHPGRGAEPHLGAGRQRHRGDPHRRRAPARGAHRAHGHLADATRRRRGPQPGQGQQAVGRRRQGPVAVHPLGADVVHVGQGGGRGQAAVRLQPGVLGRHVVLGEVGVAGDVEGHGRRGRPGSPRASATASATSCTYRS